MIWTKSNGTLTASYVQMILRRRNRKAMENSEYIPFVDMVEPILIEFSFCGTEMRRRTIGFGME